MAEIVNKTQKKKTAYTNIFRIIGLLDLIVSLAFVWGYLAGEYELFPGESIDSTISELNAYLLRHALCAHTIAVE